MSFFFTTGWGALYLGVLAVTMGAAVVWRKRYFLPSVMVLLWFLDRLAVTFLEPSTALAYLGFAYFAIACVIMFTQKPPLARHMLVSFFLVATTLGMVLGSFGTLSWDDTGSWQEFCGALAMLTILFWPGHGSRVPDAKGQDNSARGERGLFGGLASTRHKAGEKGSRRD